MTQRGYVAQVSLFRRTAIAQHLVACPVGTVRSGHASISASCSSPVPSGGSGQYADEATYARVRELLDLPVS